MKQNKSVFRSASSQVSIDVGLRAFMLRVYNIMFLGLGTTALVSYVISTQQNLLFALSGGLMWIIFFAQLGIVFFLAGRAHRMDTGTAHALFYVYAVLMGLSLAPLLYVYTGESVFRVFFITAGMFGAMSLYGYTTQKDLSKMGSIMMMGLIGVILASLVNIFFKSSGLSFLISLLAVGIFTGLTAYDTQAIKEIYQESDTQDVAEKKAILGALTLYLDFINLFVHLLRLLGDRR
jgi:FtsH-binding integral membrane protein